MKNEELLELESRCCFDFFWCEANYKANSPGYGLIRDRAPGQMDIASIASVGFGLCALTIGVERGYITYKQAYERVLGTLNTLLKHAEHIQGFFYHFLNIDTARRAWNSEVSIIDTAIVINGAITCGEYFGGLILEKACKLYSRIDWEWYRDSKRNLFYMGYCPQKGFSGWWDFYAEQLSAYILGAGSPTYPIDSEMFYSFIRNEISGEGYQDYINSWYGSIFTYQFSHAWVDFRNKVDRQGVNWWSNSVNAVKANRQYCMDMGSRFNTLHSNSWGLTPCDGPQGYNGRYGAESSAIYNNEHYVDGTVPPAGAAGSIVFTPEESMNALQYYYNNHPRLWGAYGFKDAYNIDIEPCWYSSGVIGIDKGISLLMIENYRTGLIWEYYMKNPLVQEGIRKTGLHDNSKKMHIA